jgi:hypothetical protein
MQQGGRNWNGGSMQQGGRNWNGGSVRHGGRNWNGGSVRHGGRHWHGGGGNRWHHRYPNRYCGRRFYGGFGSPWGWGWGYGYPFYGTSVALYYNGSGSGYGYSDGRVYEGRAASSDGGSVVADVQQELARAGFYRGTIDGVIGNETRNAVRAYERRNGLRVDGRIDGELLQSMGLS